jgi:hypothetical protein
MSQNNWKPTKYTYQKTFPVTHIIFHLCTINFDRYYRLSAQQWSQNITIYHCLVIKHTKTSWQMKYWCRSDRVWLHEENKRRRALSNESKGPFEQAFRWVLNGLPGSLNRWPIDTHSTEVTSREAWLNVPMPVRSSADRTTTWRVRSIVGGSSFGHGLPSQGSVWTRLLSVQTRLGSFVLFWFPWVCTYFSISIHLGRLRLQLMIYFLQFSIRNTQSLSFLLFYLKSLIFFLILGRVVSFVIVNSVIHDTMLHQVLGCES